MQYMKLCYIFRLEVHINQKHTSPGPGTVPESHLGLGSLGLGNWIMGSRMPIPAKLGLIVFLIVKYIT